MNEPHVIKLENPDPETVRHFREADLHPVYVEIAGTVYRIERVEHYLDTVGKRST